MKFLNSTNKIHKAKKILKKVIVVYFCLLFAFSATSIIVASASLNDNVLDATWRNPIQDNISEQIDQKLSKMSLSGVSESDKNTFQSFVETFSYEYAMYLWQLKSLGKNIDDAYLANGCASVANDLVGVFTNENNSYYRKYTDYLSSKKTEWSSEIASYKKQIETDDTNQKWSESAIKELFWSELNKYVSLYTSDRLVYMDGKPIFSIENLDEARLQRINDEIDKFARIYSAHIRGLILTESNLSDSQIENDISTAAQDMASDICGLGANDFDKKLEEQSNIWAQDLIAISNGGVSESELDKLNWYQSGAYHVLNFERSFATGETLKPYFVTYVGYDDEQSPDFSPELGGIIDVISGGKTQNVSTGNAATKAAFYSLWQTARTICNVLMSFGFALCLIYASVNIIDTATLDKVTPEQIFRVILKLFLAILLITNSFDITTLIIRFGNQIIVRVTSVGYGGENMFESAQAIYDYIQKKGMFDCFQVIINAVIRILGDVVVIAFAYFKIFARWLQLALLGAFAPIGFADAYGGVNSGAFKYAKRFFSVVLQAVIIFVVLQLTWALKFALGWDVWSRILVGFAGISAINGSKKWSDQILGL